MAFDAQGSLLFKGGTEGGAPHGSTGAAGLGADPGDRGRGSVLGRTGGWMKHAKHRAKLEKGRGTEAESRRRVKNETRAKRFHAGSDSRHVFELPTASFPASHIPPHSFPS